jgi:hypothetical protein
VESSCECGSELPGPIKCLETNEWLHNWWPLKWCSTPFGRSVGRSVSIGRSVGRLHALKPVRCWGSELPRHIRARVFGCFCHEATKDKSRTFKERGNPRLCTHNTAPAPAPSPRHSTSQSPFQLSCTKQRFVHCWKPVTAIGLKPYPVINKSLVTKGTARQPLFFSDAVCCWVGPYGMQPTAHGTLVSCVLHNIGKPRGIEQLVD